MKHSAIRQIAAASALVTASVVFLVRDVAAQDSRDIQAYVLTDAGFAKYQQVVRTLAALPGGIPARCDDSASDDSANGISIAATAAKLDALPRAKAAIQAAGLTTREYVLMSFSILQNGLAAWAIKQPGGKLPAGVSKANVDFIDRHQAELKQLEAYAPKDTCDEAEDGDR